MKLVVLEDWNHFFPGVPSLERLRERVEVEIQHDRPADQADLLARLRETGIVVLNRERTAFDASVIQALPELELIVQTGGIGPNVDVAAATERGIAVTAGPGLTNSIEGVAELALGWALSALADLAGRWPGSEKRSRCGSSRRGRR
jgi:D-3-phosphoglycerate dehydrogenase